MKLGRLVLLVASHGLVGAAGFGLGIYALPILTAPPAPSESEITAMSSNARYTAEFKRDLKDSDALHWGEGRVSVGAKSITLMGKLAPGPDYKLYLSPEFVETESEFNRLKPNMVRVGDVRTFENFIVDVPAGIDPEGYTSVIVWCESFGQFITSAKYR
ncbi:MAG: DM13 domain-containing protein [Candidatus Thiodiazotropha sp.]